MSETNNNNSKGGLIIAVVITIAVIYYFLKFLGVILGYTLILASIVYFLYTVFKKKKTGTIYNILKFSEETYDKKLLQTNTLILLVSGLLLMGLGKWLNVSYCECKEIVTRGEVKSALGYKEYDSLFPDQEFSASDYEECIKIYQSDLRKGTGLDRGVYGTPIGYFDYKCNNQISIISSMGVLYGNMKYKFGWGREEELAELDKMESEMFASIPKAPTQPAKDSSVVTDTLAQAQETVAAPAEVITKYQINDPDGYTNLRDSPGGKIIKKVYEGEKFELLEKGAAYSKVKLSDGTVGFMYNNRIIISN